MSFCPFLDGECKGDDCMIYDKGNNSCYIRDGMKKLVEIEGKDRGTKPLTPR